MDTNPNTKRLINHKVMRIVVGIIALTLSPVVWILSGQSEALTSISISYWTDSRDVFVGALIAVGFFLSAYNGAGDGKDWEYGLSKAACVFAVCVALFPTAGFSQLDVPANWILAISGLIGLSPENIHNAAAVLLFACLIALMWFFSNRAMEKGIPHRAYFYRAICIAMVAGIVGLLLADALFWAEAWGLSLFGLGWLVAGSYKTVEAAAG